MRAIKEIGNKDKGLNEKIQLFRREKIQDSYQIAFKKLKFFCESKKRNRTKESEFKSKIDFKHKQLFFKKLRHSKTSK